MQHCALALALDRVGERWTLLLFRELLTGPKRFKDLLENLPGIGTNLLAARLKELERDAIIRRTTLPAPAGSAVYELTELGRELEPAILALAKWGLHFMGAPKKGYAYRPSWAAAGMKFTFKPEAAQGVRETYECDLDGEIFHVRVENGSCDVRQGPAWRPEFSLKTDAHTLLKLATGQLKPKQALASGAIELRGSREALERSIAIFGLQPEQE
jgi:DNA-binding HxlR family transcriptional regulator/putative sterol carrier protein